MMETRLKENSRKLGISIDDLIDRYIKRELYNDDYYVAHCLSTQELDEILKKDVEMDKKRGIVGNHSHSDALVGICNKHD